MHVPLEVHFHNLERSPAVEAAIKKRVEKLEEFADDIESCRVTVEAAHKHHRQGNLFAVRVSIRIAGSEIVVSRDPGADHSHEDVHVALRDAFDAARRQLQDRVRVRRGDAKSHVAPKHGKIASLDADHGRIETPDGREIYFHRNSVLNGGFDQLALGADVRFSEEAGDRGPQASSVHVVGKHHVAD
jgi:ribosome-associated translation inhibitor RaiA/cold shock CspA family protein